MLGWIGDFIRFWWGLLYWNFRKTWFRLKRGRAACPCQNPSDSGCAMETGCDAAMTFDRPWRFRRVCPLLVQAPGGLRCSVDTAGVRPFWGRAAAWYGGTAAALLLAALLSVFAFMRAVGYEVSFLSLAWPPRWHEVDVARSAFFKRVAAEALAEKRFHEALLAMSQAFELNPADYELGLELARCWQTSGQIALADRIYAILLQEHPQRRPATATQWFLSLLPRADYKRIASLAGTMVVEDAPSRTAWTRALLFAVRKLGDPGPLALPAASGKPLPEPLAWVLETERMRLAGDSTAAMKRLEQRFDGHGDPYRAYYQVSTLCLDGMPVQALELLQHYRGKIGAFDESMLQLDARARQGWTPALLADLEKLGANPLPPRAAEHLCALLVRIPDASALAIVHASMKRMQPPPSLELLDLLLCACGAAQDWDRLAEVRSDINRMLGRSFSVLDRVESHYRGAPGRPRIELLIPLLPLPLEGAYTLLESSPEPIRQ